MPGLLCLDCRDFIRAALVVGKSCFLVHRTFFRSLFFFVALHTYSSLSGRDLEFGIFFLNVISF
uniref:Uncharacterized protein n=1 Tax=Rhizophora mucronata TaxID=61149 RepID=A0A2P2PSD9_RHIMU